MPNTSAIFPLYSSSHPVMVIDPTYGQTITPKIHWVEHTSHYMLSLTSLGLVLDHGHLRMTSARWKEKCPGPEQSRGSDNPNLAYSMAQENIHYPKDKFQYRKALCCVPQECQEDQRLPWLLINLISHIFARCHRRLACNTSKDLTQWQGPV